MSDLLTDTQIKAAKPAEKPYKVTDGKGMHLLVTPQGGRLWRFRYRYLGKERMISLGKWPECTLKEARRRRDAARVLVENGVDPSAHKKAAKAAAIDRAGNSFEVVAREWYGARAATWSPAHGPRILARLELNVFPYLGSEPISGIEAPQLLAMIRRIEHRGKIETAHRTLSNCGQVFRYAIATGRATRNPAADLLGALPPAQGTHFPAVTEPRQVGELLKKIDSYTAGTLVVHTALRLAPLVFVRPGELRQAKWADFDLDAAEWRFTISKTKTPHVVPLSTQAVALLRELQPLTGRGLYVFPSARTAIRPRRLTPEGLARVNSRPTSERPMSDAALCAALRSIGVPKDVMCAHGFRAMARTLLDEVLGIRFDFIEHQLGHKPKDPNGRAYNRTTFLPQRREMMQTWADYLEGLKTEPAKVVPIRAGAAA